MLFFDFMTETIQRSIERADGLSVPENKVLEDLISLRLTNVKANNQRVR